MIHSKFNKTKSFVILTGLYFSFLEVVKVKVGNDIPALLYTQKGVIINIPDTFHIIRNCVALAR